MSALQRVSPVTLLLVAAAAVSAGVLLVLGSRLTFLLDDWDFLLYRRGFTADAILGPHGADIAVGPVLVYKALLAVFGMSSALPFRVVSVGAYLVSVGVLFVYLRSRIGEWVALAGAIAILFFGAAWEDLLWPFQVGYIVSVGAGLGALLALDLQSRRGDVVAGALLTVSVLFSNLGLPFLAAGAVAVILGAPGRRARGALAIAVPAGVYALWWIGWGHEADAGITGVNIATAPLFLFDGIASSISSLLGLATPRDESAVGALDWGRPLLVAALCVAGWWLVRLRRVPPWVAVVVVLTAAFWLLAGITEKPGLDPLVSRYQYPGAIFVLLIAAELFRGRRPGRNGLIAVFAITALAVASNLSFLDQSYKTYKQGSDVERADLAALEIARDQAPEDFVLSEPVAHTGYVEVGAGAYLSAADAFGSPAFSEPELAGAPEDAQAAADSVLAAALDLRVSAVDRPIEGGGPAPTAADGGPIEALGRSCVEAAPVPGAPRVITLPPGGAEVEAGRGAADLRLRRFADGFEIDAGTLSAGGAEAIAIPVDRSARPWQLQVSSESPVRVCGVGPA